MKTYALITGASGDIGKEIAKRLASEGHDVILVARHIEKLRSTQTELKQAFPARDIRILACDVSQPDAVRQMMSGLAEAGDKLSVLVNGAGISGGGITSKVSDELWQNVINTNLNGQFYVTRDMLDLELMSEGGRIINIASTGGKQGVLHGAPYCASKHGMVGFTKALGLELARNNSKITVNAVCPGFVETEMAQRVRDHYANLWHTDEAETRKRIEARVPIGRYIDPQEVAAMVSYLVSPLAAGVTAQALNVCGGLGNY